ncbi:MAG: hypothetical protein AAGK00_04625 [Pseudomonadota bacterium]
MNAKPHLTVELVAHASLKIRTDDCCVLCDPWYLGTCFNEGWALSPAPDLEQLDLSDVTHLWISHEHPDHMHFPTLRWIADQLDPGKVTFLFQRTNSDKVFEAMAKLGFTNCRAMDHMTPLRISPTVDLFVYAHRLLDAALGVIWNGQNALLNINDTELNQADCRYITQRFGSFPYLANQFSIAGFDGVYDDEVMKGCTSEVLEKVVAQHRWLGAQYTIPMASFMYFCCPDNHGLNRYRSTVPDMCRTLEDQGLAPLVLRPGGLGLNLAAADTQAANVPEGLSDQGTSYFQQFYQTEHMPVITPADNRVEIDAIRASFTDRTRKWRANTLGYFYRRLGRVPTWIDDLGQGVILDFQTCQIVDAPAVTRDTADLIIASQPLDFAFRWPFGVQTLGVSGRLRFRSRVPQN